MIIEKKRAKPNFAPKLNSFALGKQREPFLTCQAMQ